MSLRRLTEAQYRNTIRDIFGPAVKVSGRFDPIVRPPQHLVAAGASASTISPAGIEQFDALGRSIASQVLDPINRVTFMACSPKAADSADADCTRQVLLRLGRLLFRRPLAGDEIDFYVSSANDAAKATKSYYKGLELGLAAMLVSPNFLYVIERAEPTAAGAGVLELDNYSRAARLSFLLWNSTPDETLLTAAEQGRLKDAGTLKSLASNMINSPRFVDGVRAFFADMLKFESFDDLSKDTVIYPEFNPQLARAMPEQLLQFIVGDLVTEGHDYRDLFTARRTYVNRALGPLYDIPTSASDDDWLPHEFAVSEDRGGLLAQPGFLALYSHSGRSSPTLRGRAIRELLLCQPVPDPPGNVNFSAVQDTTNKAMPTARVRLEAHRSNPVCAGCHQITDPIGLALERFDGVGAFRTKENDADIDVSGQFEGKRFDGVSDLGRTLAANPAATQCVASRAIEYATGQAHDDAQGKALTSDVVKRFARGGYRIQALFLQVATMAEAYQVKAGV